MMIGFAETFVCSFTIGRWMLEGKDRMECADAAALQTGWSLKGAVRSINWSIVIVILFAVASLAWFSVFFSWRVTLIVFSMLAFHEGGHMVMGLRFGMGLRMVCITPLGMMYIPRRPARSRLAETVMIFAGPVVGGTMAAVACAVYFITKNPYVAAISFLWAIINAFNLLPMVPLDGGQIVKSAAMSHGLKPGMGIVAVCAVIGMVVLVMQGAGYILIVLLPLGLMGLYWEYRALRKGSVQCLPMGWRGTVLALLAYAMLSLGLFDLTLLMSGVPGVSAALNSITSR